MHDDDAVGIAKENSHSVGKEWQLLMNYIMNIHLSFFHLQVVHKPKDYIVRVGDRQLWLGRDS